MDFNFKKFTSDASSMFNRAVQFTEEKLGKAEITELDPHFQQLLNRADKTEEYTRRLLACFEGYLQPNPTARVEDFVYDKLELNKQQRMNNLEALGQAMTDCSTEFGASTPYGLALSKIGATQFRIGAAEREFLTQATDRTLLELRKFLENDMKTIQKERRALINKRLDLDAAKKKLNKAKSTEHQAHSGKEGYVTVEQAEADLRVMQSDFDKQAEVVKLLCEGIETARAVHLKSLRDFAESQMTFYAQAHQQMADLQRELTGTGAAFDRVSPVPPINYSIRVVPVENGVNANGLL